MKVVFWGVRGSIPTPGSHTQRWGGNTSCLEVRHEGLQPLVLDCGTGARALGQKLVLEPGREVDLLFSHLHMDHVFGLPFFQPLFTPGYEVRISVPGYAEAEVVEKVARYLDGTYHPVRLRDVPASVAFTAVRPGTSFARGGYAVRTCGLNHPGGSLAYRIEVDGRSFVYVTDTAPFAKPDRGLAAGKPPTAAERRVVELLRGADVVVYDTMYDRAEYLDRMTWGHSYPEYAVALCEASGVGQLCLFHHAPDATDDALDALEARWAGHAALRVTMAREGQEIEVEAEGVPGRAAMEG